MFVSYQNFFAVPLVVYEHVYEVSSLYYIGKLGFQNPCFSTDSREIEYIYHSAGKRDRDLTPSPYNARWPEGPRAPKRAVRANERSE